MPVDSILTLVASDRRVLRDSVSWRSPEQCAALFESLSRKNALGSATVLAFDQQALGRSRLPELSLEAYDPDFLAHEIPGQAPQLSFNKRH